MQVNTIKAVLTRPISYMGFEGIMRTLNKGAVIQVVKLKTAIVSTHAKGHAQVQLAGSYIGMLGKDSFDIEENEFKTVD